MGDEHWSETIDWQETHARVESALDNSSYGKGEDAVMGALAAIIEWSGLEENVLLGLFEDALAEHEDTKDVA